MTMKNYPSMLSYKASISPSLFAFFSLRSSQTQEKPPEKILNKAQLAEVQKNFLPLEVFKSTLRTTIANHGEDASKKLKATGGANIQVIEKAMLPPDSNTLVIHGNIKFSANSISPEATNEQSFISIAEKYSQLFKEKIGYTELATRYFMNCINGNLLWRNKYNDNIQTIIYSSTNPDDLLNISISDINFEHPLSLDGITNNEKREKAKEFIKDIEKALSGEGKGNYTLTIYNFIEVGEGQTVYPSQEFSEEKNGKALAKFTYKKGSESIQQAVFHEQKIGNAIRTIDTWYKTGEDNLPLAIEPYGISQKEAKAYRTEKNSFYDYFLDLDKLVSNLENNKFDPDILNFLTACLIRGGVYSKSSKEAKSDTGAAE